MAIAPDQLAKYREILLDKRAALRDQVQSLDEVATSMSAASANSRVPLNIAENASDAFEQDFALLSIESEEALLRKIEEALQRIREGTYGHCAECGEEINAERLEALPFATLCVRCQTEEERGNGQGRGAERDFDVLEEETSDATPGDDDA